MELERLLPQETKIPFVEIIESLYVEGFNLSREPDYGRDIEVIGWLLDTNVISTIINPNGAPTVKAWAATQNESRFFLVSLRWPSMTKASLICRTTTPIGRGSSRHGTD